MLPQEVLSVADHGAAECLAIGGGGQTSESLMEAAGISTAFEITQRWTPRPVSVLCGPGNNGGDGFVIARILADQAWPVRLALLGLPKQLSGAAAAMAARWAGEVEPLSPAVLNSAELVVDALFGTGLRRPLIGASAEVIGATADAGLPVVAVDLPSGLFGDTGAAGKAVASATLTVSFFRHKPAHLLFPGRELCGEVVIADIGIPPAVLEEINPKTWRNCPRVWSSSFPSPDPGAHKYRRGHAVVVSGGAADTGAARLAALGAARVGAGLVTIACPQEALPIIAPAVTEILTVPFHRAGDLYDLLGERERNAVLIGPANGVSDLTRANVRAVLDASVAVVLDADALTVFADAPEELFEAMDETCVLTPHDGEFDRLFPHVADEGRLLRAREAAAISGAVVLLKGPDTVVAHPDGRAVISDNAPPSLATAGSGDVLGGILVGLRAQGMPPFEAACAAVWLHGAAATRFGRGLIASDLPELLPLVLRDLEESSG